MSISKYVVFSVRVIFSVIKLVIVFFVANSSIFRRLAYTLNFNGCNAGLLGPNSDVVRGGWRKFHNEEQRNLHFSPNVIKMIESRRVKWAGHVAHIRRRGMYFN
jgi:hypothetical protein